jgi:hypothetical protein
LSLSLWLEVRRKEEILCSEGEEKTLFSVKWRENPHHLWQERDINGCVFWNPYRQKNSKGSVLSDGKESLSLRKHRTEGDEALVLCV